MTQGFENSPLPSHNLYLHVKNYLFFGKFHSINNPLYFVVPWFPLYTVKPNGGSAVFFFFFFFFFSLIPLPLSFLSKVFDFSTKD